MKTRASFSYENFPHLWDTILNYAAVEVLRDVRLVSRALRYAIDRRVRHLMLVEPEHLKKGRYDDDLYVESWAVLGFPESHAGDSFDAICEFSIDPEPEEYAQKLVLTRLTRTLDILGGFCQEMDLASLESNNFIKRRAMFPRLETLRLTHGWEGSFTTYIPVSAETVVLFPSTRGLAANKKHPSHRHRRRDRYDTDDDLDESDTDSDLDVFTDDDQDGLNVPVHWPTPVPPPDMKFLFATVSEEGDPYGTPEGVRRIVVNLGGLSMNPGKSFYFLYCLEERIHEVVIVLPHYPDLPDLDSGYGLREDPNVFDPADLVDIMCSPWATYTVVGAEDIRAGYADEIKHSFIMATWATPHADVDYSMENFHDLRQLRPPPDLPEMTETRRSWYQTQSELKYAKAVQQERRRRQRTRKGERSAARSAARRAEWRAEERAGRGEPVSSDSEGGCWDDWSDGTSGSSEEEEITLPRVSFSCKLRSRLDRLKFVTGQEYRASVGDEKAALHLVPGGAI